MPGCKKAGCLTASPGGDKHIVTPPAAVQKQPGDLANTDPTTQQLSFPRTRHALKVYDVLDGFPGRFFSTFTVLYMKTQMTQNIFCKKVIQQGHPESSLGFFLPVNLPAAIHK